MKKHHEMFANAIPLIASENVCSPAVREAITTDLAHRYAEGVAGRRVYAGCEFIDQIELKCIELAKKYWRAGFADVRAISGVVANLVAYTALSQPGDKMMVMPIAQGGHISHNRTAINVHGLNVGFFEFDEDEMNLDVDKSIKRLKEFKPKIALFGASVFLFPHPVKEISETAKEVGAKVMYDGAHVAGLIGSGYFQQPLEEGADVFTLSTHKTFPGPQHGCVLSYEDEELNKKLRLAAFPSLLSNHHLHNVAGLAVTLTEMLKFGKEYHDQVLKNAKALGQALHERGFEVLAEKKGFTESHTLVADISKLSKTIGWGDKIEQILEKARIILNRNLIPKDIKEKRSFRSPSGIRLGTSEVTRLGMKESEMDYIADLIERICIKQQDIESVKQLVKEFRKDFQEVKYCFKSKTKAYQYIDIH
ncbi:MAG: serine hydroxymethyltransferase [Candidatus Helarchaeota archaeon]|nr:serine hydroxymethyltransferase [Candidatus Helarchaeota archaeon]